MSRAQIIRGMEEAGLFVEATEGEVHGLGANGHVYARNTGGDVWKLRESKTAKTGRLVRSEEEVVGYCRPLTRPVPSSAAVLYFDGAEVFVLEPVEVAA